MSHAVEVNEARVIATQRGSAWWAAFRSRMDTVGRIEVVTASIGGDLVLVACDDREHAEWLAGHMTSEGMPRSAVKVRSGK